MIRIAFVFLSWNVFDLQKEEQRRQERIDDWERHQKGGGYRSKYRNVEPTEAPSSSVLPTKSTKKLRSDGKRMAQTWFFSHTVGIE